MTRYTITGNDHDALAIDTGEYVRFSDVQAERERVEALLKQCRFFVGAYGPDGVQLGEALLADIDAELAILRSTP